jgi:NitT/TauT family transport system ATP-binding protein
VAEAVFLSNRILILQANPGRIVREVSIDLPYPRNEQTRESNVYQTLVGQVSALLRAVEPIPT